MEMSHKHNDKKHIKNGQTQPLNICSDVWKPFY